MSVLPENDDVFQVPDPLAADSSVDPARLLKTILLREIRSVVRTGRQKLIEASGRDYGPPVGGLECFDLVTFNGDNTNRVLNKGGFKLGLFVARDHERVEGLRTTNVGSRELIVELRTPEITAVDDSRFAINGVGVAVRFIIGSELIVDSGVTRRAVCQIGMVRDGIDAIKSIVPTGDVTVVSRTIVKSAVRAVYFENFMPRR